MAEKNYKTVAVVPEMPRTIDNQQLHIYTPVGSTGNFGVFKPDGDQFVIVDGVLRADASKLIQLADPPAIVTENGGPVGVDIAFTEPDNTLNRKFQFTFKNIKGETGATGATGLSALQTTYTWTSVSKPVIDTTSGSQFSNFNRTPVVGDTFIAIYRRLATDLKTILGVYLVYCEITSVAEETTSCNFKLVSFQEIPIKYITQITGPVTEGLNDTYTIVFSDGTAHEFVVTNGAQGETGPAGPTGEQGPKGDDGVSITSVTQTGIDGGTQVTITLSNGQSTSFDVYNGINTNFQVVNELPTENISTSTIYLVPATIPGTENVYDEYIYVNGDWEHIGSTTVDLSDYVTKTYFNQNVGDATKNYIAEQVAKVHNLYVKMYESSSVPVVGQALTLTNTNFARVPVANQYFGLLEVVNAKDKYYSVCQILSVDTTTCSAKVVAVTKVTNGTEIDSIKASIAALNTDLDGKADASALDDKLDKVKTTTPNPQVYAKNADGTQGMVNVGGTASENIATVGQTEPYHITLPNSTGKVTQDQYDELAADDRAYVYYTYYTVILAKTRNGDSGLYFTATIGTMQYRLSINKNLSYSFISFDLEQKNNKVDEITGSGTNYNYPTTKAVVDYVAANAPSAYHVELNNPSGTLTKDQVDKLVADTDSYVLYTDANSNTYKLCRNILTPNAITYSVVVNEQEYRVMIMLSTYEWQYTKVELQNVADRVSAIGTGSTVMYPNTKAVYDADQSTLTAAKAYADSILGAEQTWLAKIDSGEGV